MSLKELVKESLEVLGHFGKIVTPGSIAYQTITTKKSRFDTSLGRLLSNSIGILCDLGTMVPIYGAPIFMLNEVLNHSDGSYNKWVATSVGIFASITIGSVFRYMGYRIAKDSKEKSLKT